MFTASMLPSFIAIVALAAGLSACGERSRDREYEVEKPIGAADSGPLPVRDPSQVSDSGPLPVRDPSLVRSDSATKTSPIKKDSQ
jgi:hypothetical protein